MKDSWALPSPEEIDIIEGFAADSIQGISSGSDFESEVYNRADPDSKMKNEYFMKIETV